MPLFVYQGNAGNTFDTKQVVSAEWYRRRRTIASSNSAPGPKSKKLSRVWELFGDPLGMNLTRVWLGNENCCCPGNRGAFSLRRILI
jgi:hypothetical protein